MLQFEFSRNKNKNKNKKIKRVKHSKTSKRIVFFVIASIFTFTGLAMYVQIKSGIELSPTLTTCFYAFCTGELWMLSNIKRSKLKTGQKNEQYSSNQYGEKTNEDSNDEAKG